MKSFVLAFLCIFFLSTAGIAQSSELEFPQTGFKMQVLEPAPSADGKYLVCSMFLPSTDNFAPNVNVMVEPFEGTPKEYQSLSMEVFELMEVELLKSKVKKGFLIFEYEGDMLGPRALHVYSRVIFSGGKAVIATGTATPEQWEVHGKQLREVVDSIEGI